MMFTVLTGILVYTSCEVREDLPSNLPTIDLKENYGPYFIRDCLSIRSIVGFPADKSNIAKARWISAIKGAKRAGRTIPILESITGESTALLVIDMQRAFLDMGASIEVPKGREIVANINKLADGVRKAGGVVIFFRYLVDVNAGLLKHFEGRSYLGGDRVSPMVALQRGHPQFELYPGLDIRDSDLILDKTRYSAVLGSSIVEVLRERAIDSVVITGVTTDVCAGNTAEDLMQKDFHIVMVWDGTAALKRLEHELYLARIFGLYGDVMPTEEVLLRLK
jgi:ureidoacrylate peracid hydrolase